MMVKVYDQVQLSDGGGIMCNEQVEVYCDLKRILTE